MARVRLDVVHEAESSEGLDMAIYLSDDGVAPADSPAGAVKAAATGTRGQRGAAPCRPIVGTCTLGALLCGVAEAAQLRVDGRWEWEHQHKEGDKVGAGRQEALDATAEWSPAAEER